MAICAAVLALAAAGCAAPAPPELTGPGIVLAPAPAPAPPPVPVAPPAVSRALKHDSAAVNARVQAFIAPPSTPLEKVATLGPLAQRMNRALAVMELHRSRAGYRRADVRATRAAADAVAHFLDRQEAPQDPAGLPVPPASPEAPQP